MSLLSCALFLLLVGENQRLNPPGLESLPSAAQVRGAVDRSLPFLAEGAEVWREGRAGDGQNKRICVTCHQIPFTIWSHNEAKSRGFKIDQRKLDDLTTWTLDWCSKEKNAKTNQHTGGFLGTMNQLIMGRGASSPDRSAAETFELFGKVIGTMQQPEGWWKEGNQISRKGAEREANEVDTMWTLLGLTSLEKLGNALPKETLEASEKNRQRALRWLKESKPGTRSDWLALRSLVEREHGDAKDAQVWLKRLLDQQNLDGGWPFVKGEASHPLVTGQSLYALGVFERTGDDPAVRRAWKSLLETQQKNGSWKASSRRDLSHANVVTIHWGTGWATIGLLQTLPGKPH